MFKRWSAFGAGLKSGPAETGAAIAAWGLADRANGGHQICCVRSISPAAAKALRAVTAQLAANPAKDASRKCNRADAIAYNRRESGEVCTHPDATLKARG